MRIDGSLIGLSPNLRVDALVSGNLIIDFKVGRKFENHELALAAYTLALEANLEVRVDDHREGLSGTVDILAGRRRFAVVEVKTFKRRRFEHFTSQLFFYVYP